MFPSHWELLVIFIVVLLLFGAKRIPEMAQGLGKGIREFRRAMHEVQEEVDITKTPAPAANQVPRESAANTAPPLDSQTQAQPAETVSSDAAGKGQQSPQG